MEVLYLRQFYDPYDLIFEEVYNKNIAYLVKYLILLVNDVNIAEDLAHDIFLRIYRARNVEITGGKFRNYLKKSARNIAIDHLRKMSREDAKNRKVIPELKSLDEILYLNLENSIIGGEVLSTVQDVLENFPERNRKIFISRIMENKTRKQVSEEEKISSHAVKKIENEILYRLREKLKQYF